MKKYIFIILFISAFNLVKAQDELAFKIKYLPNHTYQLSSNMSFDIRTDLSSNKDMAAKLASQGITQPIEANFQYNSSGVSNTGTVKADNTFPLIMNMNAPAIKGTINGKPIPIPSKTNIIKIYGSVSADGKLNVDSLAGQKLTDSTAVPIKKMMNSFMGMINFPDHPLKVGESFTQNVPFNVPLGGKSMAINISITYKLTNVSGNKANFDLTQSMNMQLNLGNIKLSVNGGGAGTMVYDIKNSFPVSMNSSISLLVNINSDKINAMATAKISNDSSYVIN